MEERDRGSGSLLAGEELELKFRSLLMRLSSVLPGLEPKLGAERGGGGDEDLTFSFRLRTTVAGARAATAGEGGDGELWVSADGGGDEADRQDGFSATAMADKKLIPIYGIRHPVPLNVYALK